jgi:nucleotide-binding universal stress UspA family protein
VAVSGLFAGGAMRTILVPLDGSSFSEHALPVAIGAAARMGALLRLVAVYERMPVVRGGQGALAFDTRLDAELRAELRAYLEKCRRRIALVAPIVEVDTVVLDGSAAEAIAEHTRAAGAELVVMTTHGRRGLRRMWLGSVADALVRHLAVPALVVHPPRGEPLQLGIPNVRRILLPLDGSTESEGVIEAALALAGKHRVQYTLLRVMMSDDVLRFAAPGDDAVERTLHRKHLAVTAYLDALASRLRARGLKVGTAVREHVDPAIAILEYALEGDVDVIAMATHGRGPVGRLLVGSVADKVLRAGSVPVLLRHIPREEPAAVTAGGALEPAEHGG